MLCHDLPVASRSARASTWSFTIVVAVVGLFAVLMIRWELKVHGEDVAASHNRGLRGTFTVRHTDCGRSCHATGDFVSDDGRTAVRGIGLQQVNAGGPGTRYAVQYFAAPHRVAYPMNPSRPLWGVLFAIAAAAYLLALALSVILPPGRRFWALVWKT